MCTRSLRCPQHSDLQRKGVRAALLHPAAHRAGDPHHATVGQLMADNNSSKEMIDVDTWDDEQGDSLASLLTAQVTEMDVLRLLQIVLLHHRPSYYLAGNAFLNSDP